MVIEADLQQALHPVPDAYASARTAYSLESHADWLTRESAPFAEVEHENPNNMKALRTWLLSIGFRHKRDAFSNSHRARFHLK